MTYGNGASESAIAITRPLIPDDILAELKAVATVRVWPSHETPSPDDLAALFDGASGVISTSADRLTESVIAGLPELRVVSQNAMGTDNLDMEALSRRRIPVGYTPDVLTEATADLTWALILAVGRRIADADRYVRRGDWTDRRWDIFLGLEMAGATLGVIGFGRIGRAVARRATGFGMRVVCHSRAAHDDPTVHAWLGLDELLATSDVVSVHVPLTAETRSLIGRRELDLMRPTAILVNASRGGVVDQLALVDALHHGRLSGAGLDVFQTEPLAPGDPILDAPNCVVVPHIGSATQVTRRRMARIAADNVLAGLSGRRLPHCANPQIYDG